MGMCFGCPQLVCRLCIRASRSCKDMPHARRQQPPPPDGLAACPAGPARSAPALRVGVAAAELGHRPRSGIAQPREQLRADLVQGRAAWRHAPGAAAVVARQQRCRGGRGALQHGRWRAPGGAGQLVQAGEQDQQRGGRRGLGAQLCTGARVVAAVAVAGALPDGPSQEEVQRWPRGQARPGTEYRPGGRGRACGQYLGTGPPWRPRAPVFAPAGAPVPPAGSARSRPPAPEAAAAAPPRLRVVKVCGWGVELQPGGQRSASGRSCPHPLPSQSPAPKPQLQPPAFSPPSRP